MAEHISSNAGADEIKKMRDLVERLKGYGYQIGPFEIRHPETGELYEFKSQDGSTFVSHKTK